MAILHRRSATSTLINPGRRLLLKPAATVTASLSSQIKSSSKFFTLLLATLTRYLRAAYLLTINDFKVIVLPHTLVGLLSALAGPTLFLFPSYSSSSPTTIIPPHPFFFPFFLLTALPPTLLWNLLNLLCFNLSNQRLPSSISEDVLNKPWRPIPSGLLSPEEARGGLILLIPLVVCVSHFCLFGTGPETLLMGVMTWMYNDLGGGDDLVTRQVLNGLAFGLHTWSSGVVAVNSALGGMMQREIEMNGLGLAWCGVIGLVVASTIQVQDLPDVVGDKERGRRTMPLVVGDKGCRVLLAGAVMFWSVFTLGFWGLLGFDGRGVVGVVVVVGFLLGLGAEVARRTLWYGDNGDRDERTYKLWCVWLAGVYALPFVYSVVSGGGNGVGYAEA